MSAGWREVILLGAGVMKTTDLAKEVFDRVTGQGVQPYLKSALATSLSALAAVAYADGWRERLLLTSGIAGTAAVLHEGYAVLTTQSDANKANVISTVARKSMKAQGTSAPGRRVQPL
jgi:hypothetical protein